MRCCCCSCVRSDGGPARGRAGEDIREHVPAGAGRHGAVRRIRRGKCAWRILAWAREKKPAGSAAAQGHHSPLGRESGSWVVPAGCSLLGTFGAGARCSTQKDRHPSSYTGVLPDQHCRLLGTGSRSAAPRRSSRRCWRRSCSTQMSVTRRGAHDPVQIVARRGRGHCLDHACAATRTQATNLELRR